MPGTPGDAEVLDEAALPPQPEIDAPEPEPVIEEAKPDTEVILPPPFTGRIMVTLGTGEIVECGVKRLRAREFLALLRVFTTGFGDGIAKITLAGEDADEMQGQILGMMLVAIPEAIEEFLDFMVQVVEPVEGDPKRLRKALVDPDVNMLLDVAEAIAIQEKDDLWALLGKARAALARIKSVYQKKPE